MKPLVIGRADIERCPITALGASHYFADDEGTVHCRCHHLFAVCETCGGQIAYGTTPGSGFDRRVWHHLEAKDWSASPHAAVPRPQSRRTITAGRHGRGPVAP